MNAPGRLPEQAPAGEAPRDSGMTLIELLVGMGLFAVLGTLLLGLALSTSRVTSSTSEEANLNEESRVALERLGRELRQAEEVRHVDLDAAGNVIGITVAIDFDGDGVIDGAPSATETATSTTVGTDPEVVTYRWNPETETLSITADDAAGTSITRPILAATVSSFRVELASSLWSIPVCAAPAAACPVAISGPAAERVGATWRDLDADAASGGNNDGRPGPYPRELPLVDRLSIELTVRSEGRDRTYETQVHLRNARVHEEVAP